MDYQNFMRGHILELQFIYSQEYLISIAVKIKVNFELGFKVRNNFLNF